MSKRDIAERIISKINPQGLLNVPIIAYPDIKATAIFYWLLNKNEMFNDSVSYKIRMALDSLNCKDEKGNFIKGIFNEYHNIDSILVSNSTLYFIFYLSRLANTDHWKEIISYGKKHRFVFSNINHSKKIRGPKISFSKIFLCRKLLSERKYDKVFHEKHLLNICLLEILDWKWLKKIYYKALDKKYFSVEDLMNREFGFGSALSKMGEGIRFYDKV